MKYGMGDGVQKIGKWLLKSMAMLWVRKVREGRFNTRDY
jgi:hypothetical protein